MAARTRMRKSDPDEAGVIAPPEARGNPPASATDNEMAVENHSEKPAPAKARSRRKKASAPAAVPDAGSAERERIHTLEERLSELGSIASLRQPLPPEAESGQLSEVDPTAPPPPDPIPAPEPEPTPDGGTDRGAPIPEHYSMDRLAVMVRDPNWLFIYWELKGGGLERLRFQHSAEVIDHSRWVLRVKTLHMPQTDTVGRGANQYIVDIDLDSDKWYLKVGPSTTFRIDLGFLGQSGEFVLVLPGNEVRTPAPGVSNISDERWMVHREDLERLLKIGGTPPPMAPFPGPGSSMAQHLRRSETPRSLGLFSSGDR